MSLSPSVAGAPLVDDWLSITPEGRILVHTGKVEIGQRVTTALALIVAEELGVEPEQIEVLAADTSSAPDEGYTSGSNSIQHSGEALRFASATARRVLVERAAAHLGTNAEEVQCADGFLRHPPSNRVLTLAEAKGTAPFGVAIDADAPVRPAGTLSQVGKAAAARDLAAVVRGELRFVHDLAWPDMLHARVLRPPRYGARLRSFTAPALPDGMTLVRDGDFLAVAGESEYAVIEATEALAQRLDWHGAPLVTDDPFTALETMPRDSRLVVEGKPVEGPVPPSPPPPAQAAQVLTARFERPYQMHGAIGPSAAGALWSGSQLTLWSQTQGIFPLRGAVADVLGLEPSAIRVIHVRGAGCYGHNGADDAALDAALIARQMPDRHVLLKWSRDDEHAFEPYGSCMAVALRASLDARGQIAQWCSESFSDTHGMRPRPGPNRAGAARLLAARHLTSPPPPFVPQPNMAAHAGIHRNADPIYRLGERHVVKHLVRDLPLRTSSLRTLGAFANVFAIESFMDELAAAASRDPLAFRLAHLDDPRAAATLERVAEAIDWPRRRDGNGRGTGLAIARYKNAQAYAAVAVQLRVDEAARVQLLRAVIACDAGRVVDADGLAAQMEGGFIQAASWALTEQVTWDAAGITSRDWDTYPILRFSGVPPIETVLIDHPDKPSMGAGEASSGPAGAAIANAIHAAVGVRPRRFPFTGDNLRATAMA